ncbi:MAG: GH32 C-terminal domain-containing protein, partial [Treponemataceae bacterium]|nr:GH32 C-terminal domain-containing protein [Treponemataceae bacterium]
DTSSLEIFINGGEKVFTNNFFISSEENSFALSSTFFNAVEFSLNEIL